MGERICSVEGCDRPHRARGWCGKHYIRWLRKNLRPPDEARFWAKVDKSSDCWFWTAHKDEDGYGRFAVSAVPRPAHRVAYQLMIGEIPEGMQLDHLCHNADLTCPGGVTCIHRRCVNPDHLEPVTPGENIRRSPIVGDWQRRTTHCPRDHPYDEKNTYVARARGGGPSRSCRTCNRERARQWRAQKRKIA